MIPFIMMSLVFNTNTTGQDLSSIQQSPTYYAGTPLYMSPEQRKGKGCDQKADIYALGVIFFELNCPFKTESERYKVTSTVRLLLTQIYRNGVKDLWCSSTVWLLSTQT